MSPTLDSFVRETRKRIRGLLDLYVNLLELADPSSFVHVVDLLEHMGMGSAALICRLS